VRTGWWGEAASVWRRGAAANAKCAWTLSADLGCLRVGLLYLLGDYLGRQKLFRAYCGGAGAPIQLSF
jgi:hypothetical protein